VVSVTAGTRRGRDEMQASDSVSAKYGPESTLLKSQHYSTVSNIIKQRTKPSTELVSPCGCVNNHMLQTST